MFLLLMQPQVALNSSQLEFHFHSKNKLPDVRNSKRRRK